LDRIAYAYLLENSHCIMIESNGSWHWIDFIIFVNDHDIESEPTQQPGEGGSYRAISNDGNVMHSAIPMSETRKRDSHLGASRELACLFSGPLL
jgi:hypothetical protein